MDDSLFAAPEPDPEFGVRFRLIREGTGEPKTARYFDSVLVQRVYGREIADILGPHE